MRIRELREKARESLRGRWWQILPIALFIQLVSIIFTTIIDNIGTIEITADISDLWKKLAGIFVVNIIFIILNCIFNYVFIGKSIEFNRGNDISFSEYLAKIPSQIGKALKVSIFYVGYILKIILIPLLVMLISIFATAILPLMIVVFLVAYVIAMVKGIEASYDYALIYYLANDYEDKELKELFNKSKELMYGNRAKLIVLPLTFVGWMILAYIPLIIGSVVLNLIWPPVLFFGQVMYTAPTWALTLVDVLILFVAPITTYIMLTTTNFYESFKPQEIFNEDYVKPEINSKKYVKALTIILLLPLLLILLTNLM